MGRIAGNGWETLNPFLLSEREPVIWQGVAIPPWLSWFLLACAVVLIVLVVAIVLRQKIQWDIGNAQLLGAEEKQNDYFGTAVSENGVLAVVSDGVGHSHWARDSAEIVVKTFLQEYRAVGVIEDRMLFLKRCLTLANRRVTSEMPDIGCGATVCVALVQGNTLYWLSIGNSAIMIATGEEIIRLNKNYTELYINKAAEERTNLRYRNQYLGRVDELDAQGGVYQLKHKRQVLLCTDGIYMMMGEKQMLHILRMRADAYDKAQQIALQISHQKRSDQDNGTLIVLDSQ